MFHNAVGDDQSGDEALLVPREKTKDEIEKEDEEYREFLEREVGGDLEMLVTIDADTVGVRETPDGGDEPKKKKKEEKREKKPKDGMMEGQDADHAFLVE